MTPNLFWFSDEQWLRIEPHSPMNQPGPERKDDRRILSGIMHVIKVGCRWKDCPPEYGPHKTGVDQSRRVVLSMTLSARCIGRECATSGRLRVGKENLHVAPLVGAATCSAYRMRFT
jgi:transposase